MIYKEISNNYTMKNLSLSVGVFFIYKRDALVIASNAYK